MLGQLSWFGLAAVDKKQVGRVDSNNLTQFNTLHGAAAPALGQRRKLSR